MQAFLAQSYALCMLILALNYLAAQLLMEFAQSANEFKARLTIQRANRIFVNAHENIPLHVGLLTGAMVITTGSGLETGLAYAIIVYTAARTAWLACYKGAPKPLDASNLLSVLYGASLLALLTGLLISVSAAFSGNTEAFGHVGHTHRERADPVP